MAPQKRPRPAEGDDVIGVERASSSLRHDLQRKKVRLSVNQNASRGRNARDRSPSTASSDASDDEQLDEDTGPALPPSTQYEEFRDAEFDHIANPEHDDQVATQRLERRISRRANNRLGDNRAADNAIIEEITCINFMCHERLHVELGPLINFIVGMNGSGKSAVLTAITLCLGGKATATNRASSLKSLIRQGQNQGLLIIKLKNQGNDAYQPDLFGDSIIIERHFSTSGSSGFRLKNANGKIISTKKGDVDDIVEHYQLQVDNPMNVLSQDLAKSFITASTPSEKYNFFHKGVQLEALDNDYKLIYDTCDAMEAKLLESKDDMKARKQRWEEANEKAQLAREQEGMQKRAKSLNHKMAWVQVEEEEKELRRREQVVIAAQHDIEEEERKLAAADEAFQEVDAALERATEAHAVVQEGLLPLQNEQEKAQADVDASRKDIQTVRTEKRDITKNMKDAKADILKNQDAIKEEKRRMEDANGGAHSRKLEEIEQAKEVVAQAKDALARNKDEAPELETARSIAQEDLKKMDNIMSTKRNEHNNARERLQSLNQARGNSLDGYHRNMPQLIQAIRADQGFKETPVGPMGLHIRLLKPMWSSILEAKLGQNLEAFVVTSKSDQVRLSAILAHFGMANHCNIFIGNKHPIDTRGHEPEDRFDTILRVLDIDNELVKRQLIISSGIEQTLLIPRREDAFKTMFEGPDRSRPPRNVFQCFALHDDRRGWGLRYGFMNGGGHDISPIRPPNSNKSKMQTDIAKQIEYQQEQVRQLQREKDDTEQKRGEAYRKLKQCEDAIKKNKVALNNLKIRQQRAEEHVDNLQNEFEQLKIEDGRLNTLETLLADAESTFKIYEESFINNEMEMKRINDESSVLHRQLDAVKLRVADHEAKINKAAQKVHNISQGRRNQLHTKNALVESIDRFKAAKAKAEHKRDQAAARVADWTAQASDICARVPIEADETVAIIETELNKINQQIKLFRQRIGGTEQEIFEAAAEAHRVFTEALAIRKDLEGLLALLKKAILQRIMMYHKFRSSISAASRINFNYLLSERTFRGKLSIDHKNKKLDVHVEPDVTRKNGKGRQTKTLSGGEKSFSSICLLLALWEAMGAPLRCLDEFDVFMDDVNRDVSTKMIISAARRSVGRQFILITPKALGAGAAEAKDLDVKITKLYDPRQPRIDEMMGGDE